MRQCAAREALSMVTGAKFRCLKCGYSEQANFVGSLNILTRFLTGLYGAGFKTFFI